MGKIFMLYFVAIINLLDCSHVFGETYYISSSLGDDNNDGLTDINPKKTFNLLDSNTIKAGDKIFLKKNDVWYEPLIINKSGDDIFKIVISAYGNGDNPIINCGKKIKPEEWVKDNETFAGASFYKFKNTSSFIPYGLYDVINDKFHDYSMFTGSDPLKCKRNKDYAYKNGYIWYFNSSYPVNIMSFSGYDKGIYLNNVDNVTIENVKVIGAGYNGNKFSGGVVIQGSPERYSKNITILNVNASYNAFCGINAGYVENLNVLSSEVYSNSRAGGVYIHSGSKNVKLSNITAKYNGKYIEGSGSDRGGISIGGSGDYHINPVIENCVSSYNGLWGNGYRDAGIHIFKGLNSLIQNCQSSYNGGPGIQINGEGDVQNGEITKIINNKVFNNSNNINSLYAGGILCFRPAILSDNIIYKNNLYGNQNTSYFFGGIFLNFSTVDSVKLDVINNVSCCNYDNFNSKYCDLSVSMNPIFFNINNNFLGGSETGKIINFYGEYLDLDSYKMRSYKYYGEFNELKGDFTSNCQCGTGDNQVIPNMMEFR